MTEAYLLIDSSRRDAIIVMYIAEQFQPIFRASERNFSRGYEGRCRAPKDQKKRSPLKFGPILCTKLGKDQK